LDRIVGQRMSYSVGFSLTDELVTALAALPADAWQPAYDAEAEPRPGAWVIEATGLMDLHAWNRIRAAKDTGLTNVALHDLTQNRIWCAIVALACEPTAWAQLLALPEHPARR
jgi:hypothetical protein